MFGCGVRSLRTLASVAMLSIFATESIAHFLKTFAANSPPLPPLSCFLTTHCAVVVSGRCSEVADPDGE